VIARRQVHEHERLAIEASPELQDVLQMIAEGRFSPEEPGRYHGIVNGVWHHDYFLVSSDFASYHAAQDRVDEAYADRQRWLRMAALNTRTAGSSRRIGRSGVTWRMCGA
jgi:starch phosphorylase